jgi:type IV secretion system protein TrbJ
MKHSWLRLRLVSALIGMSLSMPAWAILGLGDIVFDPTNFEEAVRQLIQLERQYEQLVQTYQVVRNQYDHMRRMAQQVPVHMATRYRALATPWRSSSAGDAYGTTGGWVSGINTGLSVAAGYARAIERLADYGPSLAHVPADQQSRIKTSYATVELTDGSNQHMIETVGRLRGNAAAVERTIQGLEDDALSSDPAMNTEIAVLNKMSAAHLIALRSAQDTNKLLVALAEAQVIGAKRTRDAEAQAINTHIRFRTEAKATMASQAAGASAAMAAWRMP